MLINLKYLKPTYLLVSIKHSRLSAFKIWENYKEFCEYIQIKTEFDNRRPKVLEWKKNTNNDIELSVILPTYNVEKYLDKCISTLIEWKAPYVEYLFINDGSTDGSRDVIRKWAQKDSRIKLIDKENGGCASARQYGLEIAKGKYVGFVDPDDFIDGQMYKKLLSAAIIGSYDIAYCGYNKFYENIGNMERVNDLLGEPYCSGTDDKKMINNFISHGMVAIWRGIYNAELIKKEKIHFYTDLRRFDDLPFKVEIYAAARSVVAVPEYLYYYRLARPGQDVSADDERLYTHFDIFKHLNDSIATKGNQQLIDHLQICKIMTHLWVISKIKPQLKKYYVKKAKEDLLTTGSIERTYKLARDRIGEENANLYKAIMQENIDKLNVQQF